MTTTRAITIRLRNDLKSKWESSGLIPRPGEIVLAVSDGGKVELRVGDGEHTYCDLPEPHLANLPEQTYIYYPTVGGRQGQFRLDLISPDVRKAWEEHVSEDEEIHSLQDIL